MKQKIVKPWKQSFAIKELRQAGRELADQLPKMMTLQEVADKLGTSYQYVQNVEQIALGKVAMQLRAYKAQELALELNEHSSR